VTITTNLLFSGWTTIFPNTRLCKAMLDRLTDQADIIETSAESYRHAYRSAGGKKLATPKGERGSRSAWCTK
jgi:hypothetical protein